MGFAIFPRGDLIKRVGWYVNRLRCMTPVEVGHRALRAMAVRAERWGLGASATAPPANLTQRFRPWIKVAKDVDAAGYLRAADRIAAGKFDVFALRDAELGSPPNWSRDPKTGLEAPLSFGKLLDYRDQRLVGDIKYLWEINRHLHLVTLAQAHALSGDARYFEALQQHLESWFDACPHRMGPNWSSALEAALRLINWSVAWQLLGGAFAPVLVQNHARFRRRWLDSVFRHGEFIHGHLSMDSSANNHLIGEAAGLFIAALTWPCWPQARRWLATARTTLEREALAQNASDGVNLEQAVSYQQFEIDLLLLPVLAGRANGIRFSAPYTSRIEAMMEYLASIMDADGNVPMIGDSDDGLVVRLDPGTETCRYRSALATGAVFFRRREFKAKAGAFHDKARWLLGEGADAIFQRLDSTAARLPVRRAFPVGGYYILGQEFESRNEIRLVADAGPLGYQTIAAHGHADALSFTLSVGGREFFVDPGTFAYHTQGEWRGYFRGTAAHNTLRIDGLDQSFPGGNFMWLRKAGAACSLWRPSAGRDVFEGWHDGYARLADPVVHRRRITLEKHRRQVTVEDSLEMAGEHEVELFLHCSEHCEVDTLPEGFRIRQGVRSLYLSLPQVEGAATRVYCGSIAPIFGWVSRSYDRKQPAPTIRWHGRLAGACVLRTEINC